MKRRLGRWARVLLFRATAEDFAALDRVDLGLGLGATWLAGMGRYWDDPGARLAQHLGVGSVAYVFVLALLLWAVIWPLGPAGWSYERVLTFVTLVSPPALLYAFPIERYASLSTSQGVNAWFLATVALWRVALLVFFLRRHAGLTYPRLLVGAFLPLAVIVAGLTVLNLERAVFAVMGGLRTPGTPNDTAYAVLFLITYFAVLALVPLAIAYVVLVWLSWRERRDARAGPATAAGPTP